MSLTDLFEKVRSAVLHVNFVRDSEVIASGSAFVVGDYVVTNHHVFLGPHNSDVVIRFCDSDPNNFNDGVTLSHIDFESRLVAGSDKNGFDYAILRIPEVLRRVQYRFSFGVGQNFRVGQPVAFLGYPLAHLNLVCHSGTISSIYASGLVNIVQIDGSVNHSNSGGPLLNIASGEVIGIVTRKATGLTDMFDQLRKSFDNNIQALKPAIGMLGLGPVDPIAALFASQHQMKRVVSEIERSANVGIGYAFSAEHIATETVFSNLD